MLVGADGERLDGADDGGEGPLGGAVPSGRLLGADEREPPLGTVAREGVRRGRERERDEAGFCARFFKLIPRLAQKPSRVIRSLALNQLIWLTQTVRLLGVSSGAFKGLTNAIVVGSNSGYLTGMNSDWTALAAGRNCAGWTSKTSVAQGMTGVGGEISNKFLEQAHDFTYPCDNANARLYCVEQ